MATILVTGGAGFIGSHYVRHLLREEPSARVLNVDALTYSGNLENLEDVEGDPRYRFVRADIADARAMASLGEPVDEIVHLAAESHVDRSIEDATAFLRTNVLGTQVLLDLARAWKVRRFVHVSTDEVYGSLGPAGRFTEETPLAPNSPYAASKAASDLLVRAAHHTHGLPALITRCSNNYGPNQFPEKLIPLMITNAIEGRELPVYGDGLQVRDWIHVEDHCRGLEAARRLGKPGEVYNLGAGNERPNLDVVRVILRALGKPDSLIRHVADRPGHDRRYAIDPSKARRDLGFSASTPLDAGLAACVRWYLEHPRWWKRVRSGEYQDYYRRHYAARLGSL
jgi:dTDP-glucose 4,6-dehydratase